MTQPQIEDLLKKYFELDVRGDEMSKRHAEEMKPISEAKQTIKNYIQHLFNTMGTDQFKVQGLGTVFKSTSRTVQMADADEFKKFVFAPVIGGIANYLSASGWALSEQDMHTITNVIMSMPMWDMIDFRAGQKGIKDFVENGGQVPGVTINSFATVSIRRA